MPKRTYQPKKRHRAKVHGYTNRSKRRSGLRLLGRRRLKGRKRLSLSVRKP